MAKLTEVTIIAQVLFLFVSKPFIEECPSKKPINAVTVVNKERTNNTVRIVKPKESGTKGANIDLGYF